MAINKIFPWASLLIRIQYVCNRKFGINKVHEKLSQRVFLRGSLTPSHDRKTSFWYTFFFFPLSGTYKARIYYFLEDIWVYTLSRVLWFNSSWQFSPTQQLTHSSVGWERIRRAKVRKLLGWVILIIETNQNEIIK